MQLIGQKRELLGKKSQRVRRDNLVPAVVFGKHKESLPISVGYNDFIKVYKETGETSVIDLMVEGKKHPVLVKDVQLHHITSEPLHIGFYEVNLKEKLTANIPLEAENEEQNALIKSGDALLLLLMNEIAVEALPNDLPESFVVDATRLKEIGDVLTVADLEYDREKVEIYNLEADEVVAKLDYAQMLEEETAEIDEASAVAGIEATEESEEEDTEESKEE